MGHWGLAHTSWEVQDLRGGGSGTETRLCPWERQGSEFGCLCGGGQCTDPQTVMSPVPSGPGLLKPGVRLGEGSSPVWCRQHCGTPRPPGPSSAS